MDLARLTRQTGMAPGGNILCQVRPHIVGREEAVSGPNAWMSQAMNMLEEGKETEGSKNGRWGWRRHRGVMCPQTYEFGSGE